MPEVVCTFSSPELRPELANCSTDSAKRSLGSFAQIVLEFAVEQLDRIEIRRILRKIANARPHPLNRLRDAGDLVGLEVVHHDDVIAPQGFSQALIDIGPERLDLHIAGSGDIEAGPQDEINVNIAGSGHVRLLSDPAEVHTSIVGSGGITRASVRSGERSK